MLATLIDGVARRVILLAATAENLDTAEEAISSAHGHTKAAWKDYRYGDDKTASLGALMTFLRMQQTQTKEDLRASAEQLGRLIARHEIAPVAADSGDEPVVALTGNSYMPPIRALDNVEEVWQTNDMDAFEALMDGIESELEVLNVSMSSPDFDNALYVIDLNRFEMSDDVDLDDPNIWLDASSWTKKD
jgi:hypothetical protein